jgi:hypothetical protein
MLCWTSQLKTRQLSANERVWLHEYLSATGRADVTRMWPKG